MFFKSKTRSTYFDCRFVCWLGERVYIILIISFLPILTSDWDFLVLSLFIYFFNEIRVSTYHSTFPYLCIYFYIHTSIFQNVVFHKSFMIELLILVARCLNKHEFSNVFHLLLRKKSKHAFTKKSSVTLQKRSGRNSLFDEVAKATETESFPMWH